MGSEAIRCENDLRLFDELLKEPVVKQVNKQVEQLEESHAGSGTRRHLLTTSVRLSRVMAPTLHAMADECKDKLGIGIPLELYAFASPQFNAACFKPEEGRLFIMFSASLLEAFSERELLFVMGHELGHHVYRHHSIPIGYILRGKTRPPPRLALQLFAWSRYAEVSADRAGAYCAQDLDSVARALFKLASGVVNDQVVKFSLADFLAQVDDMVAVDAEPGQGAPMQDWFSTHPFSPLRVKALKLFDGSELMRPGGFTRSELEMRVQDLMQLMEPHYMEGKTAATTAMRELFIAEAIAVAAANADISETEREVVKSFLDEGYNIDKLNAERLKELLPRRIESACENASGGQLMQVLRDICLVARAEREVVESELAVLKQIATGLGVPYTFVLQCVDEELQLD